MEQSKKTEVSYLSPPACLMKSPMGTIFYLEIVINDTGLRFPFWALYGKRFHMEMSPVIKILEILSLVAEMSFSLYLLCWYNQVMHQSQTMELQSRGLLLTCGLSPWQYLGSISP